MLDPMEVIVGGALDALGIKYRKGDPLDYECDGYAIEVKQFHSERAIRQLSGREDVILIQGKAAARAFAQLLIPDTDTPEKE